MVCTAKVAHVRIAPCLGASNIAVGRNDVSITPLGVGERRSALQLSTALLQPALQNVPVAGSTTVHCFTNGCLPDCCRQERGDHHCGVMSNCIATYNHRWFAGMLCSGWVGCMLMTVRTLYIQGKYTDALAFHAAALVKRSGCIMPLIGWALLTLRVGLCNPCGVGRLRVEAESVSAELLASQQAAPLCCLPEHATTARLPGCACSDAVWEQAESYILIVLAAIYGYHAVVFIFGLFHAAGILCGKADLCVAVHRSAQS